MTYGFRVSGLIQPFSPSDGAKPRWVWLLVVSILIAAGEPSAGAAAANDDESRVPPYTLPDPLRREADGAMVTNAAQWFSQRRPELLELFAREIYGRPAPPPATPRWRDRKSVV